MVGIKWAGFVPSLVPDFRYGKQQRNLGHREKKRALLTFDALPLPCSAVCQAAFSPPCQRCLDLKVFVVRRGAVTGSSLYLNPLN